MRIHKINGQNLVEFVIIVAVIVLVGVVGLTLLGFNVNDLFKLSSKQYSKFEPFGNNNTAPPTTDTKTNPPVSNYTKVCNNGACKIDFGPFILDGIPENLPNYLQANGSAGSTEKLLSLLDQMISQSEGKTDPTKLQMIKDLSNMGHLMADYEKFVEGVAKSCTSASDPRKCMGDFLYRSANTYTPDSALISALPDYNFSFAEPGNILEVGGGMGEFLKDPSTFNTDKNASLAKSFVDQYMKVMDESSYTDAQKGIVKELYWQIGSIATELDNITWSSGSGNYNTDSFVDPITGESYDYDVSQFTPQDILTPKISNVTDINSALMCGAEYRSDSGTKCH